MGQQKMEYSWALLIQVEEERVVPGNHEGPRGGRRTGGSPPP